MSETPTPETDAINLLLENLDEWIDDSLENSKPIGLTLCSARRTIAGQRARITELWDALGMVSRQRDGIEEKLNDAWKERDEARRELKRLKKELVSVNRGAETNAKINQSLAKKLHDLEGYAARTRDHLQASSTMHRETMNERDEARREREELKRAAMEVLRVVPVAYCSEMYHGKRDMHSALEPCPVVERYNARIDKLRALLKEEA